MTKALQKNSIRCQAQTNTKFERLLHGNRPIALSIIGDFPSDRHAGPVADAGHAALEMSYFPTRLLTSFHMGIIIRNLI